MAADLKRLVTNRNFVLVWCAFAVSAFGDHLSEMAILATMGAKGKDVDITPLTARMTFVFFVPFLFFGPIWGLLSDRLPRRSLMIAADLARAVIMFFFVYLVSAFACWKGWGPFLPLALVGLFAALFSPARASLLPTLVPEDTLTSANAMMKGVGILGTIAAALVGGWLAENFQPIVSFRLDAATFIGSAVLVFAITGGRRAASIPRGKSVSAWSQTMEGVRYAWTRNRVLQLFAVAMVFWGGGSAVFAVVPALVKGAYQKPDYQSIGMFRAFMGMGILSGSVLFAITGKTIRSSTGLMLSLFGAGLFSAGLALSGLPFAGPQTLFVVGAVCTIGMGACGTGIIANYNTLLQRMIPNRLRGRIFGLLDVWTTIGLLVATGTLSIPHWAHLDQYCVQILVGLSLLFFATWAIGFWLSLRRHPMGVELGFWWVVTRTLCCVWYRMRMVTPCTVPPTGGAIVVANHRSASDPLPIISSCGYRMITYMAAKEYTNLPLLGYFTRLAKCIPVRRDGSDIEATKEALRRLRNGGVIGIFLEGRIMFPGEPPEFRKGPALLAMRTGAKVIPVWLAGMKPYRSVAWCFFQYHRARLHYGKPVDLSDLAGRRDKQALQEATDRIARALYALDPDGDLSA